MVDINPEKLYGTWTDGVVLDTYSISSTYIGDDEYGHPRFDTVRSEIGELVYRMKYKGDVAAIEDIVQASAPRLKKWIENRNVTAIIPVPFSKEREFQPVYALANRFAEELHLPCRTDLLEKISRGESKEQNKDIVVRAKQSEFCAKSVLLVDDIFDSGATLNACVSALKANFGVINTYVLCIAKKRKVIVRL